MSKKLFSSRLGGPFDEWVLVREPARGKAPVLLAQQDPETGKVKVSDTGAVARNHAVVVAVGPGRQTPEGKIVPLDERIRVGATVLFPTNIERVRFHDFKDTMESENLYYIPGGSIMDVFLPGEAPTIAPPALVALPGRA